MPLHERFYKGTRWVVAAGPLHWIGQRVIILGDIYEKDDDLWVRAATVGHPDEEFEACLSWLS